MIAATPLLLLLPLAADPAPGASCESLARLVLPATTIASAQSVAAGPMTMPQGPPVDVPALCRVAGSIKPSADSDIQFEVWLPASGWNGRFKGIGNGGFAGSLNPRGLAQAVASGYATAATDTGHRGQAATDASWAPGHPEKVVDFGYRAIHEMTVVGKALAAAFYARPVQHAYFHGCSNGGRQALMEAQRFPADYDGIIAGAPANDFTHLLAQAVWNRLATEGDPAAYIPASKVPAIEAATLAQCDAKDGVEDGVVDDPSACTLRASSLLCKGADSDACLTAAQVGAVEKLLAGPRATAVPVHPGLVAGGATGPGSWPLWITGPEPGKSLIGAFGTQFFRNMLFEDPSWDFRSFQLERDTRAADAKLARVLNATDPDLSAFRRRGGKLILWHGWSDPAISPLNAIRYYESVQAKMGARETDEFVRLFMLPGVQHCDGGPGPTGFHGAGAVKSDAQHDVNRAIERWVEEGVAPAQIVAARFKTPAEPASGVARTRPLCPYPQVARYKGTGSTDEAGSFTCAMPDKN
jgi:tannase/feruloyl esterase